MNNTSITIYHKEIDEKSRLEKWTRYNYSKAWFFGNESVVQNNGFENSNNMDARLFYSENENLNIVNFSNTDILVKGTIKKDIQSISELSEYTVYTILSIKNNNFGTKPHIHLKGQ